MPATLELDLDVTVAPTVYPARLHGAACALLGHPPPGGTPDFSAWPLVAHGERTRWRLGWLPDRPCPAPPAAVTFGRAVLELPAARFPSVALVWADGGYANKIDSSILAWAKEKLGLLVEIVKRSDDVKGFQVLPRRWVVERTFGWLIRNRRLARDYERLTATSEAMVKVAMIRLMATRLAGQSVTWANATEREALRRMKIEIQLAA